MMRSVKLNLSHRFVDPKYYLTARKRKARCVDRLLMPCQANLVTELQHTLWAVTFGEKLFFAPIGDNLRNVLDIGTGEADANER